jgi:hypothetical protein
VVKNKNEENHIFWHPLLFASLQEFGCCIGVVGAHFSILKVVIARLFAVVCVCVFFGGWWFRWWIL